MPVREVQVADERAHQPRLADAGGQREAERRETPLEVRDASETRCGSTASAAARSASLLRRHDLGDAVEDFQRLPLRRAQAQAAGDGVDVAVHLPHLLVRTGRLLRRLPAAPSGWRRCLGQVLDLQAVVVVAPFAAGEDVLRDLLDGEVRVALGFAAEGASRARAAIRSGPTSSLNCWSCSRLSVCVVT